MLYYILDTRFISEAQPGILQRFNDDYIDLQRLQYIYYVYDERVPKKLLSANQTRAKSSVDLVTIYYTTLQ